MDGWTLVRHKAERRRPTVGGGRERTGAPAAIYWVRETRNNISWRIPGQNRTIDLSVEIRSPVNAAGNGSEDPGELLSPEASARSGFFPLGVIRELYEETTPEELGLTIGR